MKSIVLTLLLASGLAQAAPAQLFKSATCGCCADYVTYLNQNGIRPQVENRDDMDAIKHRYGSAGAASCHTLVIGGYTVEGHVPVSAIKKLLREKPDLRGIAVPGMPATSPGMGTHTPGTLPVVAITRSGQIKDWGKY
ncbi:CopG family transcriptional regulator [Chitiniphilus purpureus]|uniref:CopG family transcriptional regulator n=1 Tax=Chitiniphilus purpureus TaxID=2981137 RepID=A0ABY6DPH2_9NEIS|nr:DUF411 domain-containing protein [Chitiniphilus sp. CD1]UXY14991.1 CopG family transcriptional regulator [Chitiniphilus sp. CD1]